MIFENFYLIIFSCKKSLNLCGFNKKLGILRKGNNIEDHCQIPMEVREGYLMEKDEIIIQLTDVAKEFNGDYAVENFNLYVKKGEFVTFLGPSGCGKTTTLRMIAGFELPSKGTITLNGEDITKIPPYKRPINTVFQRYALFQHLNVYDNVAFGIRLYKGLLPKIDKSTNEQIIGIDTAKIKELKKEIRKISKSKLSEEEKNEQITS